MPPQEGKIKITRQAPPPPELPIYEHIDPKEVSFFGKTNYEVAFEEKKFIFGIKRSDRWRHLYLIGKTGVGKSKTIELLIRQDIFWGQGLCLIDPYGDLTEEILGFIPEERINDVVLIDLSNINSPIAFNPLVGVAPELKHQVTQTMVEVMKRLFGANWTSRLEYVYRFVCLALLDYPFATMMGMISMLTDKNYRQKVVEYIKEKVVKNFWSIEFTSWSQKFDADAITPLVSKLDQFLSNPILRHIFSQKENKIDIEKIMNSQKILLINLSQGKLGEENASFFGLIFIAKIHQAMMARAAIRKIERKDFYIYIDEFQAIVTDTFINILSEAKKFGLCLTLTHQYQSQLSRQIQATILGNVGNIIVFRVGGDDAVALEKEMTPVFKAKDMINLSIQEFYIKMIIDGESYDPFSAKTLKVFPPLHKSFKDRIVDYNRQKYCLPIDEVKKQIEQEELKVSEII